MQRRRPCPCALYCDILKAYSTSSQMRGLAGDGVAQVMAIL